MTLRPIPSWQYRHDLKCSCCGRTRDVRLYDADSKRAVCGACAVTGRAQREGGGGSPSGVVSG